MSSILNTSTFQTTITFQTPTQKSFQIDQGECILQQQDNQLSGIQLMILVSWDIYGQVHQTSLFHLTPEVRGTIEQGQFQTQPVQLQLILQPEQLSQLEIEDLSPQTVIQKLAELSQRDPGNPLLKTEHWYLQTASQSQGKHTVSYRTLWDYVAPEALRSDFKPDSTFFEHVHQFVQASNATQELLQQEGEDLNIDLLENVSQLCQSLVSLSAAPQVADEVLIDQLMAGMTALVKASLGISAELPAVEVSPVASSQTASSTTPNKSAETQSLFTAVTAFFLQEECRVEHNRAKQLLRMPYEGNNGSWQCFAKTREETREFIFYSMAPFKVPKDKRLAVAEYICRVNYGLVLGNLELDFNDGEVRYKTSIDVENSFLSLDLVKNMVYSNVYTFDRYLPGFKAILEQQVTPAEAIAQIEAD